MLRNNILALNFITRCFSENFPVWVKSGSRAFCGTSTRRMCSTKMELVYGLLWPQPAFHGTLPRPKNSPPDCFFNGLSSPIIRQKPYKNRRYPKISPVFMGWMMGVEPTTFRATI